MGANVIIIADKYTTFNDFNTTFVLQKVCCTKKVVILHIAVKPLFIIRCFKRND